MTHAVEDTPTQSRIALPQSRARAPHPLTERTRVQRLALQELDGADAGEAAAPAPAPLVQDGHPLHGIRTTLQVIVGEASITVGELLAAQAHQVLRLDRALDGAVDLCIEGRVVARGQLVAVDGYFGVRITELPVPLDLAVAP